MYARGTSLVLDPLECLFPVHRDILRRIHAETNLGAVYAKDSHNDVLLGLLRGAVCVALL